MKKHYTIKSILFLALAAFSFQQLDAQIRIVEVDPSTNTVKLHNYGSANNPQNISSYWFCSRIAYEAVSATTLISGSTNLAIGDDVVLRMNSLDFNIVSADVGFYSSPSFTSSTAMEDFMQYGAGGIGRENVAVAKGIWDAGTFISDPAPYEYIGNGAQNGVGFWQTLLSTDDLEANSSFKIVPNPASSFINITFSAHLNNGTIRLFDMLGKQVLQTNFSENNQMTLDVSNLRNGVYLLKIDSGNQSRTQRVIIQ